MQSQENKSLPTKLEVITSVFLSLFFIVFLWGFWSNGIYALGINFAVYLAMIVIFFVSKLRKKSNYSHSDLLWIIPLLLMALSFAVYENPFFKPFNLLVFPIALALFYNISWVGNKKEANWNLYFFMKIFGRVLSFFIYLFRQVQFFASGIFKDNSTNGITKRALFGLTILMVSLLVIVPILSSADPVFAEKLKPFFDFITNILSTSVIAKIIVFVVLSVSTIASLLAWGRPLLISDTKKEVLLDLVVTSIVLGGIFVIYLVFLWVQLDRLWIGNLPFEFSDTEDLVKSGFWQLLFLSFINLAIFLFLYRKTAISGQKLLGAFSVASVLLLVSSAQRMWLYVINYGFSYEKFYASYAVLFCAVLFIWLISQLFISKKANVVKFLAFQFLWMFALVSIFPVEQFIIRSNLTLVKKESSKIKIFEMQMLSFDVLEEVKKYKTNGQLNERVKIDSIEEDKNGNLEITHDWNEWIAKQENELERKRWYEFNLSALGSD